MTYTKYIWKSTAHNLFVATVGLITINPISIIIIAAILGYIFNLAIAATYLAIVFFFLVPTLKDWALPDEEKLKETNRKLNENVHFYSQGESTTAICISSTAFFMAESLNYSSSLLINRKEINYLAMLVSSFMIVIYQKAITNIEIEKEEAKNICKNMNLEVQNDISINNHSVSASYKSTIKNESNDVILKMIKTENRKDLNNLTTNLILNYLEDKTYIDERLKEHTLKSLDKFGKGFFDAVLQQKRTAVF